MGEIIEKIALGVGYTILITFLLAGWGLLWAFPLKWAWNFVMPDLFGLKVITYWQMWCLYFILTSLWKISVHNSKD